MTSNVNSLSKTVSHALRHEPWLYELELDDDGWVSTDVLLTALRKERPEWAQLSESDLAHMIESSPKQRHEIRESKVRALYGHSLAGKLKKKPAIPPDELFHGTSPNVVPQIKSAGLLPMQRQYVHLSTDIPTAERVGRRKAEKPVVLRVLAKEAHTDGLNFYEGNDMVWLADEVPPAFIDFADQGAAR